MFHVTVDGVVRATFTDRDFAARFARAYAIGHDGKVVLHEWSLDRFPHRWTFSLTLQPDPPTENATKDDIV